MLKSLMIAFMMLGAAWAAPQDDGEAKKHEKEKLAELHKALSSPDEGGRLGAIRGLGEIADDEAVSLLAGKLAADTESVRIAAAHAIAQHRKSASVRALNSAMGPNAGRPKVLKAFIGALETLDLCSGLQVLLTLAEVDKNAVGEDALKAIGKIGCSEVVPALVPLLQRAELEEKKPDIFPGTEEAPASENRQKNKALASLAAPVRELLSSLTGKSFPNAREWATALASGKVPLKRTAVYHCPVKETTFEVPSGQPKLCPHADGKTSHEDVFLKHHKE